MSKDYYNTLGIEKGASQDEIKKAFRKKAHEFHPDKSTGDEAKFKEANEAYQTLGDDKKRAQYDQFGSAGANFGGGGRQGFGGFDFSGFQQGGGQGMEFDLNDIFSAFTGGGGGFGRQRKGRDIQLNMNLTFKESILGVQKEIRVPNESAIKDKKTVKITIPGGIESGQMIKMSGYGEDFQQGHPGDLYIVVTVTPHGTLRKEGVHLVTNMKIRLTDALLGGKKTIDGIDEEVTIKIPAGIKHGQVLRVKGKGVHVSKYQKGDLLVVVDIEFPKKFTKDEKRLIEELREKGL